MPSLKGKAQRLVHFKWHNGTPTTCHANARARNATAGTPTTCHANARARNASHRRARTM